MPYGSWSPQCAICKQSVNLEQSKTDENGSAVHEDCYVSLFISTKPRLLTGRTGTLSERLSLLSRRCAAS